MFAAEWLVVSMRFLNRHLNHFLYSTAAAIIHHASMTQSNVNAVYKSTNMEKVMIQFNKMVVVAALCGLAGCATILNDDYQKVNVVSSNAQEFSGTIDGQAFEGPGIVEFKRANEDKVINVTTPGCVKQTVASKTVDPVFFVNILSGGAFGSTTDYSTEKMWKYDDTIEINCAQ